MSTAPSASAEAGCTIYTTLDAKMQTDATHAILGTLDRKGDPAGSIVSIDPKTGQIRAMAVAQHGKTIAFDIAGRRPEAGGIDVQDVRPHAGRAAADQPVDDAVPVGALRRAGQLARPDLREHVLGPDPAHAGDPPLRQHGLRASHARPRPQADRRPRAPDGDPVEPQAGSVDRARRERGEPARPRDRLRDARRRGRRASTRPSSRRSSSPTGTPRRPPSSTREARRRTEGRGGVVTKVLEANVRSGTGTAAALSGRPAAGKTGTTDSFADAWFAGWVPQLDHGRPGSATRRASGRCADVHGIPGVTGGTLPAQIWHTYMTDALQGPAGRAVREPGSAAVQAVVRALPVRAHVARRAQAATAATTSSTRRPTSDENKKTTTQQKTTTVHTTIRRRPGPGPRLSPHDCATADHDRRRRPPLLPRRRRPRRRRPPRLRHRRRRRPPTPTRPPLQATP